VINDTINVFDESASYYKALSLVKTGAKKEAEILLDEIIDDRGFYTDKAVIKIKEIMKD